jgi:hypothetical protein
LKVGDHVTSYDPKTGKTTTQTVQQVFLNHDTDLLYVTLRTAARPIQGTTSPAVDPAYKQRMAAVASHGSHAPPSSATSATTASAPSSTATTSQSGDETIHTTANHPWLSADRGWVVAGKLQLGEQVLRADGSTAEVVALTTVHGSAPMWDLTVSNIHDFAVGNGAYVVHNCGDGAPSGTPSGYGEAHNASNAQKLREYYKNTEQYGEPRKLPDGRMRWYENPGRPPRNPGRVTLNRYVRELNPRTGVTRGWMESYEADGSVRIVHPKDIRNVVVKSLHYFFDHGRYEGGR